jgi:hypothetical protein
MDLPEAEVHSFIVKLWFESEGGPVEWHGHITHVPGGERRYFRELDDIVDFVELYLAQHNVPARGRVRGLCRWLRRRI